MARRAVPWVHDARDFQILFLSGFLVLGVWQRDWTVRPILVLTALISCLVTQVLAEGWVGLWAAIRRRPPPVSEYKFSLLSLRSAYITGLSLSLLLRANSFLTMALAGFLSIVSKFIFRYRGKHFFNPSNFGIIATGVLTGDAWVSPGQWGEDAWLALIFIGAGLVVLQRVGRWDTAVAFLGTYALLEALRNLWLGWTWDVVGHRLRSGSLLLFALFMIPDPRSIPDACWGRRVWAGSVALLTFIFKNYYFISTAPFWALFLLAPVTVWIDRTWPAPRFQWRPHGPTPEAQPQGSGVRS
jgi:Na+-transporting NADH:ubiquinone oxidoreductase subunit NqrB